VSKGESNEEVGEQSSGTESAEALAQDAAIGTRVTEAAKEPKSQVYIRIVQFARQHNINNINYICVNI